MIIRATSIPRIHDADAVLAPVCVIAFATSCYADDKSIADIADGITSYRLSAQFCHWPIPANLDGVLNSDQAHFIKKSPTAFASGVRSAKQRFKLLTHAKIDYCGEIKESRDSMTEDLKSRAK